ncbi:MAG TPA: aminotransferase class I/II-fold pyridoxal phosphate-dependent enzyme [Limnochordia bacterium]|nr:aminotransferase class I/II-fold pyridoxal phosphate-dependent enzyme [Limnochordia bacterium]
MNPLAQQLNERLAAGAPNTLAALSELGKGLYFPKGILTQTAEARAKAHRFNATIGIATEDGGPMYLPAVRDSFAADVDPAELFPYPPSPGLPALRELWREKQLRENPSLAGKSFGTPIVTSGLTHGISLCADLFCDPGDLLILPDKLWGNYNMTFGLRRGAKIVQYPFYTADGAGFNAAGLRDALMANRAAGKAIVLLNFPNNPTGYTPNEAEARAIVASLHEAAEAGLNLVCITDDAYFGLFYGDSIKESLFGRLVGLHPRITPVKVDGPTKELYVWGLRIGFITFAAPTAEALAALEAKTTGCMRSVISFVALPSQSVVLRALRAPEFPEQHRQKVAILAERARRVRALLDDARFDDAWSVYPFNSGYFMCLRLKEVDAEALRVHLLERYGVGTIALGATDLRVAFSCTELDQIEPLFDCIYRGVQDVRRA